MPLWVPRDEIRADLEDQAKKRLEEIARAAQQRRTQIVGDAQNAITQTGIDDVMGRFNSLIDPLISKGREGIDTIWNNSPDTPSAISDEARRLVEEAQQGLGGQTSSQTVAPLPGLPQPPGMQPPTPEPPTPPPPPMEMPQPPQLPSFKPPGLPGVDGLAEKAGMVGGSLSQGLGNLGGALGGLGSSIGGALDRGAQARDSGALGAGLGQAGLDLNQGAQGLAGTIGDKVTEGRDQAMELANKSLDVAQQAMGNAGERFQQTPAAALGRNIGGIAGGVGDYLTQTPEELAQTRSTPRFNAPGVDGAAPRRDPFAGITDSLAGFREQQAAAKPEADRQYEAWESYQGKEREGTGLPGLLQGAGYGWEKARRMGEEQFRTAGGFGTSGEGLKEQGQALFGGAMGPYGVLPEIARGGVEEMTGSPLAGSAAYGAASILGPGGIRDFLREGVPVVSRMLTNPRLVPEMLANDPRGTLKAAALGAGLIGGPVAGIKTGIDALREGATPQEAAAIALTNAADILQISEAAGIPIEAGAKVWGALPKLGVPKLPTPSLPVRPGEAPGALTPEGEAGLEAEQAPLGPTTEESLQGIEGTGLTVRGGDRAVQGTGRPRVPQANGVLDLALARGEGPSAAQTFQAEGDAARQAAREVAEDPVAAYDRIQKQTDAESRRPTPGTPEAPRDYDPNGLGTGIPVAPRAQVAGAAPTPRIDPRSLISDPQTTSTGPAETTPAAAESLRQVADSLAGEGPQAGERAGRPITGATDPTGFQRGVATPGKAIYDAIMSGKASTVDGFRKVVREILGRDPITAGKKSEAIDYLKGFPRTESGREVPDFLFNPEHNPAVRETADAEGNTTRTLPSGLYVTLNPQGQVIGEQRLRRADDPVSYLQGALQDYGEARDPTSGLLYRDWYIDTSGVLADVAKRVVGGDEKSPGFRNVLNNLVAAVGITTPQTEPTANVKKALYLNILYRDWKKARASAGMEVREPTWQELVDMGRTGQVVVGLKRPVAPGAPITLADEAPILGGYHTVKEGSAKVSDWEPLIPGVSGPGDHRVLAKNPAWVVDEILMGNQAESFVEAMKSGELSVKNGRKSPTFGLQLFNAWARRFLPWSVEDRHMHEAAGVNYDVESKSSGIYDILQGITRAHGDMYPGRPMDPHQSQAAIWAFEKFENAASKADNDPEMILPDAIRMPDGRVIPAGERAPRGTMLDMRNRLRQLTDQFAQGYTGPITGPSAHWNPKTGAFEPVVLKGEHIGITNEASPYEPGETNKGPFGGVRSQQVGYGVVEAAERAARQEGYAVTAEGELPGIVTDDGGRRYLDWLDEDHEVGADGRTVHTYSTDERKAQYVAARVGERTGAEAVGYVIASPQGGDRSVLLVGKPNGGAWTTGEVRALSEQVGAQASLTPDGTHVYWADTNTGAEGSGPDMGAVRAGLETHLDGSYTVREARALAGAVTSADRPAVLASTFPRDEPRRTGEPVGFGDDGRPGGATPSAPSYPSPYGSRAGGEGVKVPRRLPVPPIVGTRPFGPLGGEYTPGTRGRAASARRAAVEPVPPSGLNAPVRFTDSAGAPYDYTPAALPAPAPGVPGAPELQGAPGKPPRGPVGIAVENARITHAFDQAPSLEQGGRLLDEDGEFSPEVVQRVAQAPETNTAAGYVQATMLHLRGRLTELLPQQADAYNRAHFGGLAVGSKYYGANYDGARVLRDPEAGNQILTNLHVLQEDTAIEVRSGLITPEQAPQALAHQVVLKLIHELTHQEVWQHDGKTKPKEFTFDQALNRNLDLLAPDIDRLTEQLAGQLRENGLYDVLERQSDELYGFPRPAGEVAARPALLPGQPTGQPGDAALGADAGASGRGEPAGTLGDRPGGAEPELGTGADLGAGAAGGPGVADVATLRQSYAQHAPAQTAYHNDSKNLGSTFHPTLGNLGDQKVFMVGAYPTRTMEIDGTHEVTREQFEAFAATNADLLAAHPGLSIGTWKDNRPDGTKYVALDLSLAVDNRREARILGHLLRQDAIHKMDGHQDIEMSKKRWGPALTDEREIKNAIERILGARALEARGATATPAAGGLAGEVAGAGAPQPGAEGLGAAPDTGVAPDGSGGEADGAVAPARESALAVAYARRRRNPPPAGEPPPEWGVPEHNRQGHAMGLGNMDTPADMTRILNNPPEGGFTGDQLNEIARFGARLGAQHAMEQAKEGGITPEQRAQQSETEGRRRQVRAAEGSPDLGTTIADEMGATGATPEARAKHHTRRVQEAQGPSEVEDALTDAEDAAARGEIQQSDADDARGIAARKLQRAQGRDDPLGPTELDEATNASRQRRGLSKAEPPPPVEGDQNATPVGRRAASRTPKERQDKRTAIDKLVDSAERATAERAKAEGSAEKQPVLFPNLDARPIEPPRPGVEGEAAEVRPDITQPQRGAPSRVPLPGMEGMVTKLQSIAQDLEARAQREAPSARIPEIEGTAARLPVVAQPALGPAEPVARVAGEPLAPGEYRTELPGITARERGAPSTLAAGSTPAEVADRLAREALRQDEASAAAAQRNLAEMGPAQAREPTGPQLPLREVTGEAEGAEGLGGMVPPELGATPAGALPGLRDLGDRNILVGPNGEIMSRARAQANILGRVAKPGGWTEVRDEMLGGASDGVKMFLALGKQVPTSGADLRNIQDEAARMFGFKQPDWDRLMQGEKRFRPDHVLDMLGAYSRINLIFNPESWARNMLSTSVGLPYRLSEAAFSPVFNRAWQGIGGRDAKNTYIGESVAMLEGLARSISAATANSMHTMRFGNEAAKAQMDVSAKDAASFYDTRLGKATEGFFRPLTAGDVFFKTLNEGMESFRLAYRQASDEAGSGVWGANPLHSKIRSRMWEVASTATPKFLDQVQQAGEYNTFNTKAGEWVKRLEALKNYEGTGGPAVRLLANLMVPFVRIPVNVAKWGWERTPVGGVINTLIGGGRTKMVRDEKTGKMVRRFATDTAEMGDRTARAFQGMMLAGVLYGAEQAGLTEITGASPDDPDEKDEWRLQGKTPYSIRLGDRWFDPSNIPGLGQTVLQAGITKDAVREWQDTDEEESEGLFSRLAGTIGKGAEAYIGQEQIRPMFGSVAHALVAYNPAFPQQTREFSKKELQRSLASEITPFSGLGRAIGGQLDPTERDAKTFSEQVALLNPLTRENVTPRYDALGNEVQSERYKWAPAGITASREATEAALPRVYRGSTSAAMDREITRAVTAVQGYERDRRSYRAPTARERMLARRYGSRKNPVRERLNKRTDQAQRIRELTRSDEGLFQFRAPTRVRELLGA